MEILDCWINILEKTNKLDNVNYKDVGKKIFENVNIYCIYFENHRNRPGSCSLKREILLIDKNLNIVYFEKELKILLEDINHQFSQNEIDYVEFVMGFNDKGKRNNFDCICR